MDERTTLNRLVRGSQRALESVIRQYSPYVITVIHNRSRGCLSTEDEEEVASDVFFALWQNAKSIEPGHLRPWLGSVASHKTVDRLRKHKITIPLEENTLVVEDSLWTTLQQWEQVDKIQEALLTLKPIDREIFCRYYDLCQTTSEIATEMNIPPSTVRTKLSRGRQTLRTTLCQGGLQYELED